MKRTNFARSCIEGRGLFFDEYVAYGDIIIEYSGEQITVALNVAREKELMRQGRTRDYMLTIRDTNEVINAMNGNSDRYFNRSCESNCEYSIVMLDCDEMVVVLVTAKKDIKSGSELMVNYDWGEDETTPPIDSE